MPRFSMFDPTKATVKLANVNMGHTQGIGIILFHFSNCSIIYPFKPVYYVSDYSSKTNLSGSLNFYVGFQKVASEYFENCDFVDPKGHSWRSP